jgi:hypothetical protein
VDRGKRDSARSEIKRQEKAQARIQAFQDDDGVERDVSNHNSP